MDKVQQDMYIAMKSGNQIKTSTLRTLLSKLKDKKIDNEGNLTDSDSIKVIQKLVKQRKESADIYRNADREELAIKEEAELFELKTYLPEMMSENEIRQLIQDFIQETGAKNMADIGKIMASVMQHGAGKVDGKKANKIVRELLQ
tara:strand:- start:2099 stop:2533 length:435 start_codon:yes stop_codon:yes gene_type:complete